MNNSNNWSNSDNTNFYEHVSLKLREDYFVQGGLANGEDLQEVANYIEKSKSILDVGAGYGRALKYLIDNDFVGKITAIERSKQDCKLITDKYSDKVNVLNTDLRNYFETKKHDLILWLCSGISDFAPQEQLDILKHLLKLLTDDGYLVMDVFAQNQTPINVTSAAEKYYSMEFNGYFLHGYIPSFEEINEYVKQADCRIIEHIPYKTATARNRHIFILAN